VVYMAAGVDVDEWRAMNALYSYLLVYSFEMQRLRTSTIFVVSYKVRVGVGVESGEPQTPKFSTHHIILTPLNSSFRMFQISQ
jgi:hypothetical protein